MATAAQRRAEAHRATQARIAAALIAVVGRAYSGLVTPATLSSLDEATFRERFVEAMLPQVALYRQRSVAQAALYLRDAGVPTLDPDELIPDAVRTSLFVTGYADMLSAIAAGKPIPEAVESGRVAARGAADRHALNGGRSLTARSVQATGLGYYRVTRADCCSFCAMLQSRGMVYSEDSFDQSDPRFEGDGQIKVHDHCHCTWGVAQRGEDEPDAVRASRELWKKATRDAEGRIALSGREAQNAFRRLWEERQRSA